MKTVTLKLTEPQAEIVRDALDILSPDSEEARETKAAVLQDLEVKMVMAFQLSTFIFSWETPGGLISSVPIETTDMMSAQRIFRHQNPRVLKSGVIVFVTEVEKTKK